MPTQLIYAVKRLFTEGRELPNWRLSVVRGIPARLIIRNDTHDGENLRSRRTLCATLLDPASGQPIPEFPTMYDVQLLSMTSDELILAGIERIDGLNPIHYAQCWLATPIELAITPEWSPGNP